MCQWILRKYINQNICIWIINITTYLSHFRAPPGDRHGSVSDADSDEENEEGDYTVYECPGLAPVSIPFLQNSSILKNSINQNIKAEQIANINFQYYL